jgi:hypothetical protein
MFEISTTALDTDAVANPTDAWGPVERQLYRFWPIAAFG